MKEERGGGRGGEWGGRVGWDGRNERGQSRSREREKEAARGRGEAAASGVARGRGDDGGGGAQAAISSQNKRQRGSALLTWTHTSLTLSPPLTSLVPALHRLHPP